LFAIVNWSRERKLAVLNLRDEGHQVLALSAEIAHEMRSVINAIDQQISLVKLLQQQNTLTPEKFNESALMVNRRVSSGRYFTDLLLTYQRREHRPQKRMTNVRSVLLDAFNEFHLKEKLLLRGSIDDIGGRLVEGELIKSIMQILLKNAVDHCGVGVGISVSLRSEGSANSTWTIIDVQDDGPGIAFQDRERIFRPGDRAGKQIKYVDGGGLGLGLGFARYLAERHRGHTRLELAGTVRCVDPLVGSGARFRIMLPD